MSGRGASVGSRRVRVELGDRSYPIEIGWQNLEGVGDAIKRHTGASQAAVLTVPPVARRHAVRVVRSIRDAGLRAKRFEVPDGERSKSLAQAGKLYDALLEAGAARDTVVVAVGGGVIGDLSGYVAATLLRGLPFVQVPTSLLAMVDSSVGGKTGVNVRQGKNLVGAFHQPRLVWIDAHTLTTLPPRQRSAGMAEVIKHAAIWDARLFARLESEIERVMALEPEVLLPVLERNCQIKAEVVSRDEREAGLRRLLNFGHTLGHAAEALKRYRGLLHGEAVAMGMVYAARRCEAMELCPKGTSDRLSALIERAGLPLELPAFPRKAYLTAVRADKKREDARIHFVALRKIGRAETVPLLPEEIVPAGARIGSGAKRGSGGAG